MKQVIKCHSCESPQPKDWKPGDHCTECGDVIREDVSCAWCAHAVPNQKFCRDCGFEMVEPQLFGVARMLKDSGIDKLSLAARVREMPGDQIAHYKTMYNRHLAVLNSRVEEIRLCEHFLVGKSYSRRFEEAYLGKIPFDEGTLEQLKQGPQGPFENRIDKLREVITNSPIQQTRTLGTLASVFTNEVNWDGDFISRREAEITSLFLRSSDTDLRIESMAAFATGKMVRVLMKERQFPKLKGRFGDQAFQFVQQHWEDLTEQVRMRIAPFVVRMEKIEQLPPAIQESIKVSLSQASNFHDEELQFAAFVANQNGRELFSIIEKAPESENAELAAQLIAKSQFPSECGKLMLGGHRHLRKIVFDALYESQNNVFREHHVHEDIAKAAVQYLQAGNDEEFLQEALYIIAQVPGFKQDMVRILQTIEAKTGKPDILIYALHSSGDDETSKAVIEQLLKYELSEEILKVLCFKSDKVNFGQEMIQKVIDYRTGPVYNNDEQRHLVQPIVVKQMQREDEACFLMIRALMNALFINHPKPIYEVLRPLWRGEPREQYIDPLTGNKEKFAIDTAHLQRYFDSPAAFAKGFAAMLQDLDSEDAQFMAWLYRAFWEPFDEGWCQFLRDIPETQLEIAKGWADLIRNEKLHEPTRSYGTKALGKIYPILLPDVRKQIDPLLVDVPKVSSTGSLGREIREITA